MLERRRTLPTNAEAMQKWYTRTWLYYKLPMDYTTVYDYCARLLLLSVLKTTPLAKWEYCLLNDSLSRDSHHFLVMITTEPTEHSSRFDKLHLIFDAR